jgi:hypothetical protein
VIEFAAVDDHVVVESENRLEAFRLAYNAGIAALAKRIEKKYPALPASFTYSENASATRGTANFGINSSHAAAAARVVSACRCVIACAWRKLKPPSSDACSPANAAFCLSICRSRC